MPEISEGVWNVWHVFWSVMNYCRWYKYIDFWWLFKWLVQNSIGDHLKENCAQTCKAYELNSRCLHTCDVCICACTCKSQLSVQVTFIQFILRHSVLCTYPITPQQSANAVWFPTCMFENQSRCAGQERQDNSVTLVLSSPPQHRVVHCIPSSNCVKSTTGNWLQKEHILMFMASYQL